MLRNLILVINLCLCSLYAQNFTNDYKASLKAFGAPCSFDWIQKTGTDSSIIHYEISEKSYYAKGKNFEILATQEMHILVLKQEKKILLSKNKQISNEIQLFDTLITYGQLTIKENKILEESIYYLVSYPNSRFSQVEFWFDKSTKRIIKSKAKLKFEVNMDLESTLANYNTQINQEKLKIDYFITKFGDQFIPSTNFQNFKINSTSL